MKIIITSDWHLRETAPPCRTDDFLEAQWKKVQFISDLQQQYGCPVIHAGDLFDHWKPSPWLLSKTMEHLPMDFHTIYGNHDLPQHNLELQNKTGIWALHKAGKLHIIEKGVHWGVIPSKDSIIHWNGLKIMVWHIGVYQGKLPYPGCTDPLATALLRKWGRNCDLIITGHYHISFHETYENATLINGGGITRQESDEANKIPRVALFDTETRVVNWIPLPFSPGVVTKPISVQKIEERNDRIDAFISRLDTDWEANSISFEANMERYLKDNPVEEPVKTLIQEAIE